MITSPSISLCTVSILPPRRRCNQSTITSLKGVIPQLYHTSPTQPKQLNHTTNSIIQLKLLGFTNVEPSSWDPQGTQPAKSITMLSSNPSNQLINSKSPTLVPVSSLQRTQLILNHVFQRRLSNMQIPKGLPHYRVRVSTWIPHSPAIKKFKVWTKSQVHTNGAMPNVMCPPLHPITN